MVRVRMFAALREAAGTAETEIEPGRLGEICAVLRSRYGPGFAGILGFATIMVDGHRVADPAAAVADGAELALLPPFAGG